MSPLFRPGDDPLFRDDEPLAEWEREFLKREYAEMQAWSPCPVCGEKISPDEDWERYHTRRDRFRRWLRRNVTMHLWR
jgi:hypothetical protein